MSKYTPGPWERIDTADYAEIHPRGERLRSAIALVGKPEDADLIAAAPDMLDALKLLGKWFEITGSSIVQRWDRITAEDRATIVAATKTAIAKAEGRS